MFPKISIIIPCYWVNNDLIKMTDKCLETMGDRGEKIVVDDGSLLPHKPECDQLIVLEENGGYAKAVNAGLAEAQGDILIICNNDIEFIQPDWLDHLTKPLKTYDICSIRTTDSDGWDTEDKYEEDAKFGSIWAMKRKVYDELGGLDEFFGNYFEDLDYHERAKRANYKIVKNHAGLVEHKGKSTFKVIDPDDAAYHTARARFKEKWGKVW